MSLHPLELKRKAIDLRHRGYSLGAVAQELKISKSTLSGWFKNVEMSSNSKKILLENWKSGLAKARIKSVLWHNQQKNNRLALAKNEAERVIEKIDVNDISTQELALAMLYLGEGDKGVKFGLGSSNPKILNFFLDSISNLYSISRDQVACELNLRADQNKEEIINYWSSTLNLPLHCFMTATLDPRTIGRPTYADYKGVCHIRFGSAHTQRRLSFLSELYCDIVRKNMGD